MIEPIIEYDEKGNITHFKSSYGYEFWKEYDEKRNETHYKNVNGCESWTEYDDKGKVTHYKSSDEYEEWREYDKDGKYKCALTYFSDGEIITKNENLFSDKLRKKHNLLLLRGRR